MITPILNRLNINQFLPYIYFFTFVFISKLIIIHFYGNATPYWDQWDAEADNLYRPLIEGSLTWYDLFAAHNEHRIFTTRLLAITVLYVNDGIWNPILQMQINAALHTFSLVILLYFLSKNLLKSQKNSLIIFSSILFSIPFGWENTLSGFQSQFYFLLLFSFIFLWIIISFDSNSKSWWLFIPIGILCTLSLASGVITLIVGMFLIFLKYILDKDKKKLQAIILLITLIAITLLLTPSVEGHAALKAKSADQLINALTAILTWPYQGFLLAIFIYSPILIIFFLLLKNKEYRDPTILFLGSLGLWFFGQVLSIAYGRAADVNASRYIDIFSIGLLLNFIAFGFIQNKNKYKILNIFWFFWSFIVLTGLFYNLNNLEYKLNFKKKHSLIQEYNVRNYLCSENIVYLNNDSYLSIPYPDPSRLKNLLDNSTIRKILPGNIYIENTKNLIITPDGEPFCDPGKLANPFNIKKWDEKNKLNIASINSIKQTTWQGTDYFNSSLYNFKIIGSYISSENDTGIITLSIKRGSSILYRSGPRVTGQSLLINSNHKNKFYTSLPISVEWHILDFSNPELPENFDITLIDSGTKWGEWSAIALQE